MSTKSKHPKGIIFTFTERTLFNSIILLSLVSCITLAISIELTNLITEHKTEDGKKVKNVFDIKRLLLSLLICFIATFIAYYLIVYLFGFGKNLYDETL